MWKIIYTKQAQKDAKKLSRAGFRKKAEDLLEIIGTIHIKIHLRLKNLLAI